MFKLFANRFVVTGFPLVQGQALEHFPEETYDLTFLVHGGVVIGLDRTGDRYTPWGVVCGHVKPVANVPGFPHELGLTFFG